MQWLAKLSFISNILFIGSAAIVLQRFAHRNGAIFVRTGSSQIEQRHAHGYAIRHLFEHDGLRAVGNFRRNLDAAIHRAGMEDYGVGIRAAQALGVELVAEDVVFRGNARFELTFGLHTQDINYVCTLQGFFYFEHTADLGLWAGDFFEFFGDPHSRAAQGELAAEFSQEMNVGTGYAAVLDIAEDGDVEVFDGSFAVADGQSVEQTLRGMFMRAVASVNHRDVKVAGDERGRAGGGVAHHQAIGLHGVEILYRI